MNDRFLFRGKRKDNGEWVKGYYVPAGDVATIIQPTRMGFHAEKPEGSADAWMVDPATVGQCTGLRDKNGTLIYEGDICKDSTGWVFEVIWDDIDARFLGRQSKPRGDTYICYVGRVPAAEILGNVHDNLELLEDAV